MERISIIIADDHEIIHSGLAEIFKSEKNLEIVGHAYNGEEALEQAVNLQPQVIFMDMAMPGMNGIEATLQIRLKNSSSKIIALTQHEENEYVIQFMNAGGNGYLLKNSRKENFIAAISSVLEGKMYLSSEVSENMLQSLGQPKTADGENREVHLTRREIEIIRMIAEDKSNHEIANELHISLRTVETHRRNLMQKLEARSVVALLKYASKRGLIKI